MNRADEIRQLNRLSLKELIADLPVLVNIDKICFR